MELAEAVEIVRTLANGRDPLTGRTLVADHVCQHPQVVRALCLVVHTLGPPQALPGSTAKELENAGKPWTPGEEAALTRAFEEGATISQLARKHGRTRQAIQGRLYRLGKVSQWQLTARHR
jgi:hypothetical protein